MAASGQGYFAFPPKVSGRFSNNFVKMFLGWPSIRFLQAKLIGRKLWPPGDGAYIAKVKKEKQVSDPGPSWPSCFTIYVQSRLLQNCCMRKRVNNFSVISQLPVHLSMCFQSYHSYQFTYPCVFSHITVTSSPTHVFPVITQCPFHLPMCFQS